jgi:hypothetical protein
MSQSGIGRSCHEGGSLACHDPGPTVVVSSHALQERGKGLGETVAPGGIVKERTRINAGGIFNRRGRAVGGELIQEEAGPGDG